MNSWTPHKTALCNIYNSIDPDIILINDTSNKNSAPFKIFNYNTFQTNKSNSVHSGIGIAVKKNITTRLIDDFITDILAVRIETQQGHIVIATTYIPPRTQYLNYIDFNKLFRRPEPTYLLADLNAKHRILGNNYNNTVGRAIDILIQQNKCIYLGPNFPTLISHNSATKPDIVLSNHAAFHNIHLRPGPITPSDHIPIIATISASPIQIPIKPRKSFHRANWQRYKQILQTVQPPTDPNPTLEEIDYLLSTFNSTVQTAADQAIPTIQYRTVPGIKPNDITKLLQVLYSNTLQYIAENGPTYILNRRLIHLRNRLQEEYRELNRNIFRTFIEKLNETDDPQTFWKGVKRFQGNNKQSLPYLKDQQGTQLDTAQEKEPLFRNHWQEIFTADDEDNNNFNYPFIEQIERELNQNIDKTIPHDTGQIDRLNGTFLPITMQEMTFTLSKFKQRAPGPTGITTLHLKNLPKNMKQYLLYIFNHSISAGYFPDSFKIAHMIFLPKPSSNQSQVKNYRPISLLDVHGKLLDKILNTRLTNHLETNNITNPRQHGFRKFRGTHTALATFNDTIAKNLAIDNKVDVVLRDVTKAFDKVWHTGLKTKLIRLNLHPCFTKTLCDYLSDRKAAIRISSHIGPLFDLESGVPQGACLSPTLYSFYTHDIPDPLPNTDYICFADDITQITFGHYNYKAAAHNTKYAIEQINQFENNWKIRTNKSKFTVIPIHRHKTESIEIDDNIIPYTGHGKILGLNISKFGITQQVNQRVAIAKSNLNKLYRFKHLSPKLKKLLYIATVRSALIYPTIPLHTLAKTPMQKLQRVQNRAVRFITNTSLLDRITSETLHHRCNLSPVNTILHDQAQKIWQDIQINHPELYNQLTIDPELIPRQKGFKSSLHIATTQHPTPKYT